MNIDWVWLFLDTPATQARESWDFWAAATGQQVDDVRGDQEQFATLVPGSGDPWVKLQAVGATGGVHLDLDSPDIVTATDHALSCGATLDRHYYDVAVMLSPGGFTFCLTRTDGPSVQHRDHRPLLDQACLDVPPAAFEAEVAFWERLTGWERRALGSDEFVALARPDGIPVRVLLQRLDAGATEPLPRVTAHLDLACGAHREEVAARHLELGAQIVSEERWWSVLRDPVGRTYCLTDRDPVTGLLAW